MTKKEQRTANLGLAKVAVQGHLTTPTGAELKGNWRIMHQGVYIVKLAANRINRNKMKSFGLLFIVFFALSCGTENHYFKKSLTKADKIYLSDNDTLIKKFSGKANWYKQYWTGNLLVRKNKKGFDIKEIGEWRQTSRDGRELYTIANFDKFGYVKDERILGAEGMPPIGETQCKRDTVDGQIRLVCEYTNRYQTGQLKEKGKKIIINDKGTKEGKWEYYTETGTLEKVVEYIKDKPVR